MLRPRPASDSTSRRPWRAGIARALLPVAAVLLTLTAGGRPSRPPIPQPAGDECTIAVLSGRSTADHRPLLWKNRDSGSVDNEVVCLDDGAIRCLSVVNAGETVNSWIGVNERGFAIVNALSYNLPDRFSGGITNGRLMKLALQTCATAADFESLLVRTNLSGRDNPANLAVIDAQGAAVMYEVGNWSFVRIDARDPRSAPAGFVVRTNFSLSADTAGLPTWRFRRATSLVRRVVDAGGAAVRDLQGFARDLGAADLDPYPLPYEGAPPGYPQAYGYVDTRETINRRDGVASGVIAGVRPGEDPRLSTFYAGIGQPAVSPGIPLWVAAGATPPELDGPQTAPLCDLEKARLRDCHDSPYAPFLINTFKLVHADQGRSGFLTEAARVEATLTTQAGGLLARWRRNGVDVAEMAATERQMSTWALEELSRWTPAGTVRGPQAALACFPNPSRGEIGIRYVLAEGEGAGEIEVFDVSGRRMARFHLSGAADGSGGFRGLVRWNGRDSRGRRVPPGIYLVRQRSAAGIRSATVSILGRSGA